jgi:hypothetical protein
LGEVVQKGFHSMICSAIQTRSNGNPGWIESFLISLLQDGGLYIIEANLTQINDLGLVCPPLYMMARSLDSVLKTFFPIWELQDHEGRKYQVATHHGGEEEVYGFDGGTRRLEKIHRQLSSTEYQALSCLLFVTLLLTRTAT